MTFQRPDVGFMSRTAGVTTPWETWTAGTLYELEREVVCETGTPAATARRTCDGDDFMLSAEPKTARPTLIPPMRTAPKAASPIRIRRLTPPPMFWDRVLA